MEGLEYIFSSFAAIFALCSGIFLGLYSSEELKPGKKIIKTAAIISFSIFLAFAVGFLEISLAVKIFSGIIFFSAYIFTNRDDLAVFFSLLILPLIKNEHSAAAMLPLAFFMISEGMLFAANNYFKGSKMNAKEKKIVWGQFAKKYYFLPIIVLVVFAIMMIF